MGGSIKFTYLLTIVSCIDTQAIFEKDNYNVPTQIDELTGKQVEMLALGAHHTLATTSKIVGCGLVCYTVFFIYGVAS